MKNVFDHFFERVEYDNDCLIWKAGKWDGYGRYYIDGVCRLAHRMAFLWLGESIISGTYLHHKCHRKDCVNPCHLQQMTHDEHERYHREQRSHCKRGHIYDENNTSWQRAKNGRYYRCCKRCKYLANRGLLKG